MITFVALLSAATYSHAAPPTLELDAATDFTTTLMKAKAQKVRVEVGLKSGEKFRGNVHSVAGSRVVLENLELRDYFSVLISLPEIVSIEVRTRTE
jgi:small nuclear ribonucleoprotein (snRNP)-like protein